MPASAVNSRLLSINCDEQDGAGVVFSGGLSGIVQRLQIKALRYRF